MLPKSTKYQFCCRQWDASIQSQNAKKSRLHELTTGGNRCSDNGFSDSSYSDNRCSNKVSRRRVGSVHDFLAGRVNWNSSDVLELGYSSRHLQRQQPDANHAIVLVTSSFVGQKSRRGRGTLQISNKILTKSCKFPTEIIGACPEFRNFGRKFSDKKKIFLQFSMAQNFWRVSCPEPPVKTPLFASTLPRVLCAKGTKYCCCIRTSPRLQQVKPG